MQLGLFDPAPLVPRVKPTVADLLDGTWAPPAWPKGYACIYLTRRIETRQGYVGKAVDLRARFREHKKDDEYIDRALKKHGAENFSIEILWTAFTEADAYAQEGSFIEEHRTNWKHGGFNISEGGAGWTSEDSKRWHNTPEGRAATARGTARGNEVLARRAGYPQRRVLAELEKGPRTIASLASALGFTMGKVQNAFDDLRGKGHHMIGDRGGLWRLVTLEEAADRWASGRALSNEDRVLGALMEGPRTVPELTALGMPRNSVNNSIACLRKKGYNIVNRGWRRGPGGHFGTLRIIIDHKRHPWLHVGMMNLRGAAWDDRCNSVAI